MPLVLTVQLIGVAVGLAAVVGIVGAWAAAVLQSSGPGGKLGSNLFRLGMIAAIAMPLILHAAAWEATAGKFGWLTITQTGTRTRGTGVYGYFSGLVASGWIHGLYGAAIVALTTRYGTSLIPRSIVEQAALNFGPTAIWWRIRLPIALPWVITGLVATAAIAAAEMTVVDLFGFRTVADTFYLYHTINPSIRPLLVTMTLPLLVVAGGLLWLSVSRRRLTQIQSNEYDAETAIEQQSNRWVLCLAGAVMLVLMTTICVVPMAGLIVKAGHEVTVDRERITATWSALSAWQRILAAPRLFAAEYQWTALIAGVTGLGAVCVAWPLAMLGHGNRSFEKSMDLMSVTAFVVPGPIIGMLMVNMFQQDLPGFRFLYGQTILPTVLALMARATPVAYWFLRSGYRGIQDQVLDTARIEYSLVARMWHVDRPLLKSSLWLAFLASTLFASGDVAVMLPVIPAGVTTVATRLFELLHSGARYQEASLAIWHVIAVLLVASFVAWSHQSRTD